MPRANLVIRIIIVVASYTLSIHLARKSDFFEVALYESTSVFSEKSFFFITQYNEHIVANNPGFLGNSLNLSYMIKSVLLRNKIVF